MRMMLFKVQLLKLEEIQAFTHPSRIDLLPGISVVVGKMSHFKGISVVVGNMSHS